MSQKKYPKKNVDIPGFERGSPACEAGALPLGHIPELLLI